MAIKHKSRKQRLKQPDEFLSFSGKLLETVIKHKVYAVSGLVLLLAAVLLVSGINYMANRSENRAFVLLEKGISEYDRVLAIDGPKKAFAASAENFGPLLEDYSGRDGGKLARIVYAGMAYDAKEFDKAIALYKEALDDVDDYPAFKPFIVGGLGRAYEAKNDWAKAELNFQRIAQSPDPLLKEDAYLNLGLIYDQMGNQEKTAEIFKKFIADYPNSAFIGMVREKLANS